ncbi:MAG: TraR/DksA family transcriptional regulator [Pseudomonadota bacterium]
MIDQAEFKTLLNQRRAYLEKKLVQFEHSLDRPKSADFEDQAIEAENDEVIEGLGSAGLAELRRIDEALHRIEAGEYGLCHSCGEEIPAARLRVVPEAQVCTGCMPR